MPLRALLLIVFFLGSLPVCFIRPFYGIMLWTVIAFLNPQAYSWSMDVFPWAAAVAVPTMLGMLLFDRKFERLVSGGCALLAVLWGWFTVTTLVSINTPEFAHHAVDTLYKWKFVSKILLMTACMIVIVSSFQRLRYLVLAIAGCFGLFILKSFPFIIATGGEFRIYGPDQSMIADNNDFGLALNMTLPLFFFLAQTEPNRWGRRFFGMLFLMTIPVIFFTYSRGALLGLTAVLLVMFLRARRRFLLIPVIAIGVVVAVAFAPEAWKQRMDPNQDLDTSARSRLTAWAYARALAADYPITGGGFATFTEELYDHYGMMYSSNVYGPHSVYFQVLGEHGYVGLVLYLVLVLSCFVNGWRLRREARARGDRQIAAYSLMLECSMVGFLTTGMFLGRAYFDYYFTLVACVLILDSVARERWAGADLGKTYTPPAEERPPRFSRAATA